MSEPIKRGEATWEIRELAQTYPAPWSHVNKQLVASIAGNDVETPGTITVTRWKARGLPEQVLHRSQVIIQPGFFEYKVPDSDDTSTHVHLNFADPYLFGYGEGSLLAQDELQIVEHPILVSLAKKMELALIPGLERKTVVGEAATPVLVQGAPRRCRLNTQDYAIYGDNFGRAPTSLIEKAITKIDPPTISNILAICALRPREGLYTTEQIAELFQTSYAGFRAAVLSCGKVTLHAGHWGCGAFGGNKGLVAAIQILAAGTAGIDKVVYWYGSGVGDETAVQHGLQVADLLNGMDTLRAIELLDSAAYGWGIANENYVPYQPPKCCLLERAKEELA